MSADITNPREHVFTWVPLHQEVFSALKSHGTFPYGNPTTDCSDQGFHPLRLGVQLTYFLLIQSAYIHLFLSPVSFEVLYWTFDRQLRDSGTKVKWEGEKDQMFWNTGTKWDTFLVRSSASSDLVAPSSRACSDHTWVSVPSTSGT